MKHFDNDIDIAIANEFAKQEEKVDKRDARQAKQWRTLGKALAYGTVSKVRIYINPPSGEYHSVDCKTPEELEQALEVIPK